LTTDSVANAWCNDLSVFVLGILLFKVNDVVGHSGLVYELRKKEKRNN
jgi:hypothetical protein